MSQENGELSSESNPSKSTDEIKYHSLTVKLKLADGIIISRVMHYLVGTLERANNGRGMDWLLSSEAEEMGGRVGEEWQEYLNKNKEKND